MTEIDPEKLVDGYDEFVEVISDKSRSCGR
jgi:hypothetical protein